MGADCLVQKTRVFFFFGLKWGVLWFLKEERTQEQFLEALGRPFGGEEVFDDVDDVVGKRREASRHRCTWTLPA